VRSQKLLKLSKKLGRAVPLLYRQMDKRQTSLCIGAVHKIVTPPPVFALVGVVVKLDCDAGPQGCPVTEHKVHMFLRHAPEGGEIVGRCQQKVSKPHLALNDGHRADGFHKCCVELAFGGREQAWCGAIGQGGAAWLSRAVLPCASPLPDSIRDGKNECSWESKKENKEEKQAPSKRGVVYVGGRLGLNDSNLFSGNVCAASRKRCGEVVRGMKRSVTFSKASVLVFVKFATVLPLGVYHLLSAFGHGVYSSCVTLRVCFCCQPTYCKKQSVG